MNHWCVMKSCGPQLPPWLIRDDSVFCWTQTSFEETPVQSCTTWWNALHFTLDSRQNICTNYSIIILIPDKTSTNYYIKKWTLLSCFQTKHLQIITSRSEHYYLDSRQNIYKLLNYYLDSRQNIYKLLNYLVSRQNIYKLLHQEVKIIFLEKKTSQNEITFYLE